MDCAEIEVGIERIKQLSRLVIDGFARLTDFEFGLNPQSVEWVEDFIERERERRASQGGMPEGLVNTLGSFLGECILATNGKLESLT